MSTKTKCIASILVGTCILITSALGINAANFTQSEQAQIKNVILLIPDGMSVTGTTLARWCNNGEPLAMDEMASGLVRTYWAGGPITDSAPAGTAMATGYKTTDKFISVLPDKVLMPNVAPVKPEDSRSPIATVLEGAKLQGKAVGLVATSNIQHATPAAFSSHTPSRSEYETIGEQQVFGNIDVILGAGWQYLMPDKRKDKEDLIKILVNKGYDYVTTPAQMKKSKSDKIWGLFAADSLAYDMDRDPSKEPSLAEMTEKAISVLSKDEDGFFLMVEGSKVDWAAHANDPVGVISDIFAFDKAVKAALDFAKKDTHTVVIACSDHGNGGISMGSVTTEKNYSSADLSIFIDQLKKAKLTGEGLEKKLNSDKTNIKEAISEYYGISDLTDEELKQIKDAKLPGLNSIVGKMISKRASIGWTTGGHTGEDVVLYCYSPNADRLTGVVENTDIAKYISKLFNMNLDDISKKLYVPAVEAFEARGAKVAIDESNAANPVVVVTKGSRVIKLPVNKNIAYVNGSPIKLGGLTIITNKAYVPQDAVNLIK
ncbi:MAG: alkaline phosphatase [Clostridia bacterium]|nr:alkaline phosphatase [Clostridia bacterium]